VYGVDHRQSVSWTVSLVGGPDRDGDDACDTENDEHDERTHECDEACGNERLFGAVSSPSSRSPSRFPSPYPARSPSCSLFVDYAGVPARLPLRSASAIGPFGKFPDVDGGGGDRGGGGDEAASCPRGDSCACATSSHAHSHPHFSCHAFPPTHSQTDRGVVSH
jgi:hypothetical protein